MNNATSQGLVDPATMQAMVDRLVADFSPDKVILFGSYAYGTPTPDSDVDLLVIVPEISEKSWKTRVAMMAAIYPVVPKSVDLLLSTWPKAQRACDENDPFFRPALNQGKVLYDRQT